MIDEVPAIARTAMLEVTAHGSGAARNDITHGTGVTGEHAVAKARTIVWPVLTDDVSQGGHDANRATNLASND
jgi:predicted MarR family transcription regulator